MTGQSSGAVNTRVPHVFPFSQSLPPGFTQVPSMVVPLWWVPGEQRENGVSYVMGISQISF